MYAASVLGYVFSFCAFCDIGFSQLTADLERAQPRWLPKDLIEARFRAPHSATSQIPDLSGKWYATFRCGVGSGNYIYYFEQTRNGRLSGKSRGVSFGVKDITGSLVTGSFTATGFEFFEHVSEGYFIEVSGSTQLEQGYLFATYKNTRVGTECNLRMRKMRDQRNVDY